MGNLTERQLAKAYVVERTIENTRLYLLEGRQYVDCTDEEVTGLWVGTFRDLAGTNFSQELQRVAILDIESELGLRRIAIPFDQVQPELALFSKHVERRRREGRPGPSDCPECRAELADLHERLSRPKH
ncbi:MAG TPA: hypothetical protein VGJ56_02655 [Reyranella sp.]